MVRDQPIHRWHYEEWGLKDDSPPGWIIVMNALKHYVQQGGRITGWVLATDLKEYRLRNMFDPEDVNDTPGTIKWAMTIRAMSCIHFNTRLEQTGMLQFYTKFDQGSVGDIQELYDRQVLPGAIEDDPHIPWQQTPLLVINHDGDPVYVLQYTSEEMNEGKPSADDQVTFDDYGDATP